MSTYHSRRPTRDPSTTTPLCGTAERISTIYTRLPGDVKKGDTILVHAAAGGVGVILCQWGNALGATVIGTPYELARALGGRRNESQLRELTWHGDPDPYIAALAQMGPAEALPC